MIIVENQIRQNKIDFPEDSAFENMNSVEHKKRCNLALKEIQDKKYSSAEKVFQNLRRKVYAKV